MCILYIVDHPRRDLPALSWWANKKFVLQNHKIFLIPSSSISTFLINKLNPEYIVWNFARPTNSLLIKFSFSKGIKNIVHDTEGIPYVTDYFSSCDDNTFKCLHNIWCWGTEQEEIINKRAHKLGINKLGICLGSIRYEFYKSIDKQENSPSKILFNTNFGVISPRYGSLKANHNIWVNLEKNMDNIGFLKFSISLSAMRESIIQTIIQLIKNYGLKPKNIILRTHPFESTLPYERLKDIGIEISDEADIHEDIKRSKFLVSCGSQTTLDGLIQDKFTIVLKPYLENIWSEVSSKGDALTISKAFFDKDYFNMLKFKSQKNTDLRVTKLLFNFKNRLDLKSINLIRRKSSARPSLKFYCYFYSRFFLFMKFLKEKIKMILRKNNSNIKPKISFKTIENYLKDKNIKYKITSDGYLYL